MTYIENIFICMVSPLLVAALCMGRRQLRFFLFCIAGSAAHRRVPRHARYCRKHPDR